MSINTSKETPKESAHVFASYAHADIEKVRPEIDAIGRLVPVWYDDNIRPGSRWNDELASAIVDCAAFVLFVSPNATNSQHCLRELQFALAESKPLIAIHLVPTELPHGLRFALGDTQAILKYALTSQRYAARLEATFRELGSETAARSGNPSRGRMPWSPTGHPSPYYRSPCCPATLKPRLLRWACPKT